MAYSGDPILAQDLLFRPVHSIIDQSLHSRLGATTTNGDGFGIGWYGEGGEPAVFKGVDPAWNDENLREIAGRITHTVAVRPHPGVDRDAGAALQLPSVPARALAVDAQRRHPRDSTRSSGTW